MDTQEIRKEHQFCLENLDLQSRILFAKYHKGYLYVKGIKDNKAIDVEFFYELEKIKIGKLKDVSLNKNIDLLYQDLNPPIPGKDVIQNIPYLDIYPIYQNDTRTYDIHLSVSIYPKYISDCLLFEGMITKDNNILFNAGLFNHNVNSLKRQHQYNREQYELIKDLFERVPIT